MPMPRLAIERQKKATEMEGICTSLQQKLGDFSAHTNALTEEISGLKRSLKEHEKKEEEDLKASKKIAAQMAKVQRAAQQAEATESKHTKAGGSGSKDQSDSERILIFML
jgi:hypothetical protein